jgi:hypothetical protein
VKCPNGHVSAASDYCDTCGEAMPAAPSYAEGSPSAGASGPAVVGEAGAPAVDSADPGAGRGNGSAIGGASSGGGSDQPCPNCGVPNPAGALFCENCGYDHTTGQMPRREDPAAAGAPAPGPDANTAPALDPPWVAEVWIDPAWYAQQESPDPLPSPGLPAVVALRHTSLLIGRHSASRGITPDIDCGVDNGVSRRHAQLTTDGTRWWVEDLASSNGTFIGAATEPPPSTAIPVGAKREIGPDDRIYVGSWTRIVLRVATDGEV